MEKMRIKVNGKVYEVEVEFLGGDGAVLNESDTNNVSVPIKKKSSKNAKAGVITSPISGTIKKINVKAGDEVKEGQTVAVIEAMKMDTDIVADVSGEVKEVKIKEGQSVKQGEELIILG